MKGSKNGIVVGNKNKKYFLTNNIHENISAFVDIQNRINDEIGDAVNTVHYSINENGHYCCRFCDEAIRDINYMYSRKSYR